MVRRIPPRKSDVEAPLERLDPVGTISDPAMDQPYLELGRRIGRLLEESQEAADDVRRTAQTEATELLRSARRTAVAAEEEADRLLRRARSEGSSLLEDARSTAAQLSERITRQRQAAIAEITVLRREAQRDAEGIKKEAHERAEEIVAAATAKVAERAKQLERRIMQLQLVESELQARIERLKSKPEA